MSEDQKKTNRGSASWTPEDRTIIARKGGLAVSADRAHMSEIGKKGGLSVSKDRKHMSELGKRGGKALKKARDDAGSEQT